MTQSLTERLAEQLEEQRARIESVTASELQKLGANLGTELSAVLASIRSAMAAGAASTTASFTKDMARLRRVGRWWAGAVVLSWVTILALLGSLLWLWMSPPSTTALLSEAGVGPAFEVEGQTYLLLPRGSRATWCMQDRERRVPCVALPVQARSTAPSLERTLQEQAEQASADGGSASGTPASGSVAQGAEPNEGGRLLWPPAARPQTRPEVQPGQEG